MKNEFWNSELTEKSWEKLVELRKEVDFILIGGWAVYLYTKLHKSKDIDIIVDYSNLRVLSSKYDIVKNDGLKKYEIKLEQFDIEIYLPGYSRLKPRPEDILKSLKTSVGGFSVPTPEALIFLKLEALEQRKGSIKGGKDEIDVLGMLFYSNLDLNILKKLFEDYNSISHATLLHDVLTGFDKSLVSYLNLNEKTFSDLKRTHVAKMREVFK